MANAQQRPGWNVSDSRGFHHDDAGAALGKAPVPIQNVGRDHAVFGGPPGHHGRHPGAVVELAMAVSTQRQRSKQARLFRFLTGRPATGLRKVLDTLGRPPHCHWIVLVRVSPG